MLGNLYVAAKYWAWGYADGMANAGGPGSRGRQRKRYLIEGRAYWADASELPGLVAAIVQRPPKVEKAVAKAVQRPAKARNAAAAVPVARPDPALVEARLERLEAQFQQMDDELLLRSLAIARQRLLDMEEDDLTVLLLA